MNKPSTWCRISIGFLMDFPSRTLGRQGVALSRQAHQVLQSLPRCGGAINEHRTASFLGGAGGPPELLHNGHLR